MLARKYDYYQWEETQVEQEIQQPVRRVNYKPDIRRQLRNRLVVGVSLILAAYLFTVVRSESMVQYGNQLVALQRQEAILVDQNNELKIEVEQLKGPDRIISLAEQRLGMSVARSNIYLKAAQQKNNIGTLALADK